MLKVKKLKDNAIIPERKTSGSAGYDLCACINEEINLEAGKTVMIPTGIAAEIPQGYAGMIFTRSGLGIKHGVHVTNGVGVIDSDYRGEIMVGLRNLGEKSYVILPNERIAQLVLLAVFTPDTQEVEELTETDRGNGGFGSTGK